MNLRNALRLPLHLRGQLKSASGTHSVKTLNISAAGVLFQTVFSLEICTPVEFTVEIPGDAFGIHQPVLVSCLGRVVRCTGRPSKYCLAVIIDEYHFERSDERGSA